MEISNINLKNIKRMVVVPIAICLSLAAQTAFAGVDDYVPPGLNPGDQFRLVFVTSTTRDATSKDINVYDQFVTNSANAAGLDNFEGLPVTWRVLGSTWSFDAIVRLPASSPPIYRLDGQQVAASGADIWDGTLVNPISISEVGETLAVSVWVGSNSDGTRPHNRSRYFTLGSSNTTNVTASGLSDRSDTGWLSNPACSWGCRENYNLKHLYAFSSVLTVPAVVDSDGDGVPDITDNCPADINPEQDNNDNDAFGDVCDPDDDNDGIIDTEDNCPINVNLEQLDDDFDGLGNACDAFFNNDTAADNVQTNVSIAVSEITFSNAPGGNGLIAKLTGKRGVIARISGAVLDYDSELIDLESYIAELESAISMLEAFDNQITAKVSNGQIGEPQASNILDASAEIRLTIENLIAAAI
jgi:hypothetical protein